MILNFTYPLNAILIFALAIGLGVWVTQRYQIGWRLWWIGAGTFVLSQVGHIPFNILLTNLFRAGTLPSPPEEWNLYFNAIILGLSAGLWEETFRYGAYRWFAKQARDWRRALVLGAGHGGIEAILLGILVLITFFQMFALKDASPPANLSPEQLKLLQVELNAYWSAPWYLSLLGALERGFSLILHLALSVLVLQVFYRQSIIWLFAAILWHALVNAVALIILNIWGPLAAEGSLACLAALSLVIIWSAKPRDQVDQDLDPIPDSEPPMVMGKADHEEVTAEDLDRSRYI